MNIITTIHIRNIKYQINRKEHEITDKDMFLDCGSGPALITQNLEEQLRGGDYETLKLTKKAIQHILSFPQVEHETEARFWKGCRLFSITAKETT